jgi:hypothetical protein
MNLTMITRALTASLLAAALALSACGGGGSSDAPTDAPTTSPPPGSPPPNGGQPPEARPGMGDSTSPPTGMPLTLPAGVTIGQPLRAVEFDCTPPEQRTPIFLGRGNTVRICLELTNNTPNAIVVELPPGEIWVSDKITTQNGILIVPAVITVAPQSKIYVNLFLLCLNKARAPTSGPDDTFTVGPVTQDPAVLELIELVRGKALDVLDDGVLQKALWNITDGDGLTDEDRAAIRAL